MVLDPFSIIVVDDAEQGYCQRLERNPPGRRSEPLVAVDARAFVVGQERRRDRNDRSERARGRVVQHAVDSRGLRAAVGGVVLVDDHRVDATVGVVGKG